MGEILDWNEIEQEYVAGEGSYRLLAKKHGVSRARLAQRGKEGGWVEKRLGYSRDLQELKADAAQLQQRTGRLLEVADKLLDRVEELGSEAGVTAASIKTLTEALKNIRDAQMIKSAKDLLEQQARIEKMRRELERSGQESGGITVRLEEKTGEFAA